MRGRHLSPIWTDNVKISCSWFLYQQSQKGGCQQNTPTVSFCRWLLCSPQTHPAWISVSQNTSLLLFCPRTGLDFRHLMVQTSGPWIRLQGNYCAAVVHKMESTYDKFTICFCLIHPIICRFISSQCEDESDSLAALEDPKTAAQVSVQYVCWIHRQPGLNALANWRYFKATGESKSVCAAFFL